MSLFSNKYFKDKEEEQDFFISLVVILFFGAGIYFFALPALSPVSETALEVAAPEVEKKKRFLEASEEEDGAIDIEAYVAKLKEEKIENTKILAAKKKSERIAISDAAKTAAVAVIPEAVIEEEAKVVEAPIIVEEAVEETIEPEEVVKEVVAKVKPKAEPAQDKPVAITKSTTDGDCTIMVGAFKDALNAEVLKQRLTNDGYKTYEETRGKFSLVGIKAPCDPTKLENALLIMRSNYSADAFILLEE